MTSTIETILLYTIGAGLLSIVYGYLTGKNILNSSAGNSKMQDIASAIQIGAKAYLARQYKTIAIVGVVVLVIVSFAFNMLVGLGYLIGATLSGIAGYVGMLVSVQANVRTADGESSLVSIWPGFRQGGRFSTTAGKSQYAEYYDFHAET